MRPKWNVVAVLALMSALVLMPSPAATQAPVVIKLATLVPEGSVWDKAMREMGAEWSQATGGRVQLRVYPGGVAGDEPDVVRKMRIGQLQAGAITSAGLSDIDPAFNVFGIPMFFDAYPELYAVLDKMEPTLKKRLEDKGFVLLNWGHGGWVYFFTKQPVRTVAELRKLKLFSWAGDDKMTQLWKTNGFTPVALAATDILTGLQTGMIEAYPTTPLLALTLQWYQKTPYMAGVGMAPLVGGLVITRSAWEKISEPDRAKILTACAKLERRLKAGVPAQDSSAVNEMKQRGLKVVAIDAATVVEWRATAEHFASEMRGTMIPPDILDAATRERNAFRQRSGK
ncbi:MAG: TRAP transporter substrate-binding protein DctP [Candidatus Eisenbacteria bacterium]|uniref:TRAP transporter substrate-binding protein DctP n=1 Tax=Eiseniibacteriota bacterium TaxID=2212470 RepID=A0A9D6L6Y3_UNCEI|nr:TRAP transporter substrate-binding protein DctP [Candidatus Eisenbacteria bacterium]MBI3538755.1 TRAP transporter substrate-binding protein DctP [Candidatus Eisenbacteria bacterium]